MCEISTFCHLCGHLNKTVMHFCSACIHERIEQQTYSVDLQRMRRPLSRCDPAPTSVCLVPTLCKSCTGNSEVSEYLEKNPEAEFEIFRSWKASFRAAKVKAMAEGDGRDAWQRPVLEEDTSDISSAESMPFISLAEISSSLSATTQGTSLVDSEDSGPDVEGARGLTETKGRIAALKGRVADALAGTTY